MHVLSACHVHIDIIAVMIVIQGEDLPTSESLEDNSDLLALPPAYEEVTRSEFRSEGSNTLHPLQIVAIVAPCNGIKI